VGNWSGEGAWVVADHVFSLSEGSQLYEYRIDRILGHGGFGITYLAEDTLLQEPVAIKEFLPNELAVRDSTNTVKPKSADEQEIFQWGLQAFLSEARTIARFRHPNVMRVRRFFETNGTGYLVMDFEKGITFDKWLAANTVTEENLRPMLLALLDGLDVVHAAGVLHRDIKPSNIIVHPDGSPLLIDFGAARDVRARLSRSLTAIVTVGYAPLEQYASSTAQGPWTDLYALGAVAYRAMFGKAPPDAILRVREDPMVPAAEAGKGRFSAEFLRAVDWALIPDERHRPQTAAALRDALSGRETAVLPVKDGSRSAAAKHGRPRDHRRLFAGIGGVLIALGVVGIAFISLRPGEAPLPPVAAPLPAPAPQLHMEVTVDGSGKADASTIAAGLAMAAPGAIIHVRAGRYAETLSLDKAVTLEGDPASPQAVILESPKGPAATVSARGVTVRGMSLAASDDCLVVTAGGVTIEDVRVSSQNGTGIIIRDRAEPNIKRLTILKAGLYGLSIEGRAGGTYSDLLITNTRDAAMRVLDSADPTVRQVEASDAGGAGLLLSRGARGRFSGLKIVRAAQSSIEVGDNASPDIDDSELRDGRQSGIFVHSGGGGQFRRIVLSGHEYPQIAIDGATQAIFDGNTLENGRSDGIYVTRGGRADFRSNVVKGNKGHGAVVDLGSTPRLLLNRFSGNQAPQILASETAHPELTQNSFDAQ